MATFLVEYFYLATGMEGHADERDFGYVEAESPEQAREIVIDRECAGLGKHERDFFASCLSTRLMSKPKS